MIGKSISHYKILDKLGEGGMGVVYKAEDTKLKRTVALKFLSSNLVGDEKDRFFREAQAAAALNHPNIATIFEIDEAEGQTFIAMEFIEGRSLSQLINSPHSTGSGQALEGGVPQSGTGGVSLGRPLPLDHAIDYATQIAAGLQAAHEKGVTHRDIKSANVMVTDKGQVKIMDFGLAKLTGRSKITQLGATMGTAAYMSPEQARGEDTDNRADIWSLGVVLYEMISGQLPFKGEYEHAVIYSILNEEPEPLTALRTGVPIALDGIVAKALAKDRDTRYQHVDELPADLSALDNASLSKSRISTKPPKIATHFQSAWQIKTLLPWLLLGGTLLLALTALIILWQTTRREPEPVARFVIPLPERAFDRSPWNQLAFSPDGRKIVYGSGTSTGETQLYLRDLEKIEPTPIPGTEGAISPFFSPDGQWIGFFDNRKLWKISIFGGKRLPLCDSPGGVFPGAWGEGSIIFTPQFKFNGGLWRVSDEGGEPERLTQPNESKGEVGHRFPQFLPDGEHVLFTIKPPSSNFDEASIAIVSLKTGAIKKLFTGGSFARYLPTGHLVYVLAENLMAVPFDLDRLEVVGSPVVLQESGSYDVGFGIPQLAFSHTGTLVYLPGASTPSNARLSWLDRSGIGTDISKELGKVNWASLQPDGKWVALEIAEDASVYIGLWEVERDILTRLTFDSEPNAHFPFWTRDGERVVYQSFQAEGTRLSWKRRDGTGDAEVLSTSGPTWYSGSWSPDGNTLAYTGVGVTPEALLDLWLFNYPENKAEVFLSTPFDEREPAFSPDGGWIAYACDESGRSEIYARPFPAKEPKKIISNEGGQRPFWSPDGRELFYLKGRRLMVVPISQQGENSLSPGSPRELFELPPGYQLGQGMSKDGKRFLALKTEVDEEQSSRHLIVVQNWFEEVKRKVAEGQ